MCLMLITLMCGEREFADGARGGREGERGMHPFMRTDDMGEGNERGQYGRGREQREEED